MDVSTSPSSFYSFLLLTELLVLVDTPDLAGGFAVWLSAQDRKWLSGRYVSVCWDVERLEELKDEIVAKDKLKSKLVE